MKKFSAAWVLLLILEACNFRPEIPVDDKKTTSFIKKYDTTCLGVGSDTASLNANNIKALSASSDTLWVATWGGGLSSISTSGTITTYRAATHTAMGSDYCTMAAGGGGKAMASCLDSTNKNTLAYFNGTAWTASIGFPATPTWPFRAIRYNGTSFYVVEDKRTDGYLANTGNQSKLYLYDSNGNKTTDSDTKTFATETNQTPTIISINSLAVVDGALDRDGHLLMAGYFADTDTDHGHGSVSYRHLSVHRRDSALNYKNPGSGAIKPVEVGDSWNTPLAIGYLDKTVSSTAFEKIYFASDLKFYVFDFVGYSTVNSIQTYTTSNGIPSMNARQIAVMDSAAWVATDAGIGVLESGWETMSRSNTNLTSNNIQAIATFNSAVWVGTDSGLCKITKKADS